MSSLRASILSHNEGHSLLNRLPSIQGRYGLNVLLSQHTWFQVGGHADVIVKPSDIHDLRSFIQNKPSDLSVLALGSGSNMLIRDGGFRGAVLKLGKEFAKITIHDDVVVVGSGCLDRTLVLECRNHGLSGLEFLVGIPGTIGGAVAMNAGAYGFEVKDFLLWAEFMLPNGEITRLTPKQLGMTYRNGNIPKGSIVTQAAFRCYQDQVESIQNRIDEYLFMRETSQPIKGRTGGSTFKNPEDQKAWQLIDLAGCRGLKVGDAQVSQKHCNFLLNLGNATAYDLETLGEVVRNRVYLKTGVSLEWEIIRSGDDLQGIEMRESVA
jgi:UDP-N-acetylmuramate dehydrogenase